MVPPHFLDSGVHGEHLLASFPELEHDFGINLGFLPMLVKADASAASIYDDDEMLCSIPGHQSTEIKEVTIGQI